MCAQGQICRQKVSCEVYLSTDSAAPESIVMRPLRVLMEPFPTEFSGMSVDEHSTRPGTKSTAAMSNPPMSQPSCSILHVTDSSSSFATTTVVLLVALLGPTVLGSMSPLTTTAAETGPFVFALALAALAALPVLAALACKALALALAFLGLAGATL